MTSVLPRGTKSPDSLATKLNKLRAGVLGANDGIVSVAATVIGVAAATENAMVIATAGVASLIAGAFSMATGEYISVSTQRDTEAALVDRVEQMEHDEMLEKISANLVAAGVSHDVALAAAGQMAEHDAVEAMSRTEGIDPDDLVNPWHAAWASFFSFITGATLPLLTILLIPAAARIPATFAAVLVALALTGYVSARLGDAQPRRAVLRTMFGGALAMAATYGIGNLFDV